MKRLSYKAEKLEDDKLYRVTVSRGGDPLRVIDVEAKDENAALEQAKEANKTIESLSIQ